MTIVMTTTAMMRRPEACPPQPRTMQTRRLQSVELQGWLNPQSFLCDMCLAEPPRHTWVAVAPAAGMSSPACASRLDRDGCRVVLPASS